MLKFGKNPVRNIKMENPLDVLSRAASMVETNDSLNHSCSRKYGVWQYPTYHEQFVRYNTTVRPIPIRIRAHGLFPGFDNYPHHIPRRTILEGDISYKRICDRDSPSKLPTKVLKSDPIHDRHDNLLLPAHNYHHEVFGKKSTNSVTSYSEYAPEKFQVADPFHNGGTLHYRGLTSVSSPFLYTYPPSASKPYSHPLHFSSGKLSIISKVQASQCRPASRSYASPDMNLDIHDPIEEHFRRSLGKDYPECISNKSSPSASPISPDRPFMTQFPYVNALTSSLTEASFHEVPGTTKSSNEASSSYRDNVRNNKNASVEECCTNDVNIPIKFTNLENVKHPTQNVTISATESVDDHFSKSLGDHMWSKLKVNGSVDDHFHKALGDTWLRIKAESEPNDSQSRNHRTVVYS